MGQTMRELARQAMSAYDALESFEATQKISAGPIHAEARIRFKKPDKITVEYRSYQNPVSDFEERFTGAVEFVADELVGMQLIYDGKERGSTRPRTMLPSISSDELSTRRCLGRIPWLKSDFCGISRVISCCATRVRKR